MDTHSKQPDSALENLTFRGSAPTKPSTADYFANEDADREIFGDELVDLESIDFENDNPDDDNLNDKVWPQELTLDPESEQRVQQRWQQVRCYGFQVGSYHLLAPLNIYCELLTKVRIEALPNSPEHFLGLSNVRGNLVPVYQIEPLLDAKAIAPNYALVIGDLKQAGALLVSAKPTPFDLRSFQACTTAPVIHDSLQQAVTACYQLDDTPWYLINHQKLFQHLANIGCSVFQ